MNKYQQGRRDGMVEVFTRLSAEGICALDKIADEIAKGEQHPLVRGYANKEVNRVMGWTNATTLKYMRREASRTSEFIVLQDARENRLQGFDVYRTEGEAPDHRNWVAWFMALPLMELLRKEVTVNDPMQLTINPNGSAVLRFGTTIEKPISAEDLQVFVDRAEGIT